MLVAWQPGPPPAKTAAAVKKCKCTFEYIATNEDELTIKVDDIITILKQEEEGWWEGEFNGKRGVFPNNFVEELPADATEDLAAGGNTEEEDAASQLTVKAKKVHGIGLGNIFGAGGMPMLKKSCGYRSMAYPAQLSLHPPPKKTTPPTRTRPCCLLNRLP